MPPDESGVATSPAGGVRIAWRAYGSGEPLLMIMGFMGSGRAWFRLLPHVAAGHRGVAIDNRGTGDSQKSGGRWHMADMVADTLAAMDDAGLERAHVLGASMGGMIAQQVALAAPERVRSLTLACTSPVGSNGAPPWRMMASLGLRPLIGVRRSFPIVAPLLYAEGTRRERTDRIEEDLRMRDADPTPPATMLGQGAAIREHDVLERLGEIEAPTLVIHGDEDRLIPPAAGRALAALIPGARLVLIPGTGHLLTTDAEQETSDALLGFLAEVETAATPQPA